MSLKTNRTIFIFIALGVLVGALFGRYKDSFDGAKGEANTKILFVGDMMFDRTMRKVGEEKGYGYLFSCAKDYLSRFDFVVANLEGPITESGSISLATKPGEPGNTTFTFSPKVAGTLFDANVRAVSLGNNHILDFGREGAESTKAALDASEVAYFGDPYGDVSLSLTAGGKNVALVNFNQFLGQSDPQKTIDAIWEAKRKSDFIAVYAHWGDEYVPTNDYQRALAHRFIDAGADLVVGSHPHVIQEAETYEGKPIYYSLGNFIFDQYWEESVRTGLGLEVGLSREGVEVSEARFDIQRGGLTCLKR